MRSVEVCYDCPKVGPQILQMINIFPISNSRALSALILGLPLGISFPPFVPAMNLLNPAAFTFFFVELEILMDSAHDLVSILLPSIVKSSGILVDWEIHLASILPLRIRTARFGKDGPGCS